MTKSGQAISEPLPRRVNYWLLAYAVAVLPVGVAGWVGLGLLGLSAAVFWVTATFVGLQWLIRSVTERDSGWLLAAAMAIALLGLSTLALALLFVTASLV